MPSTCPKCQGRKTIPCAGCDGNGFYDVTPGYQRTCPDCDGTGYVPCPDCGGSGRIA